MSKLSFAFLAVFLLCATAGAHSAQACTFTRSTYYRDSVQQPWQVFKAEASTEMEPAIYGFMNSFDYGKKVLDFFFWKVVCSPDAGVSANVQLESNQIPVTLDWQTIWADEFVFEYGQVYKWNETIGTREFQFVFSFTR